MSEHHGHHVAVEEPLPEELLPEEDGIEIEQESEDVEGSGDLDVESFDDETEEVEESPKAGTKTKAKAAAKVTKKRGELPEGYVTPVGFAHWLTENGYGGKDEDGDLLVFPPQAVYSTIKNAPKDYPFPVENVKDSIGTERFCMKLEAAIDWWKEKVARTASRKAGAKAKTAKKATEAKVTEAEGDHEEAED